MMGDDTTTVGNRFERMASISGSRDALTFREAGVWTHWTYERLARRASAIVAGLQKLGLHPGEGVGVVASRTPETIAALIAILKHGSFYVPLDPAYPTTRLQLMCTEAGVRHVLSDGSRALPAGAMTGLTELTTADMLDSHEQNAGTDVPVTAATPAYVMFTSGSTGTPKGVVVPHRALVRLIDAPNFMRLDATAALVHMAPLCFDASTLEIWGPLLNGGRCVLYPDDQLPTASGMRAVLTHGKANALFLTTSLFNSFVDQDAGALGGLRDLLTGGELVSVSHVVRAIGQLPGTRITHVYGPTENTTFSTYYPVPVDITAEQTTIPIGFPVSGTGALVVDEQLKTVPDGAEGELVLSGSGLALGYLNRPDLTAERFVPVLDGERMQRCYRTGDRVVRQTDQAIVFLGRFDDQVKIEGHRIEPGEIEQALVSVPGVRLSRVLVRTSPHGLRRLSAYVVLDDPALRTTLRPLLASRVPGYMMPHFFIFLDELPVTANGKLDASRLPDPFATTAVEQPRRGDISGNSRPDLAMIREAWQHILGHDAFTDDTNFFDAGGTSLDAVHLQELLTRRLDRPLDPTFVFEHATSRRQAEALGAPEAEVQPGPQRGQQRRASLDRHARGGR